MGAESEEKKPTKLLTNQIGALWESEAQTELRSTPNREMKKTQLPSLPSPKQKEGNRERGKGGKGGGGTHGGWLSSVTFTCAFRHPKRQCIEIKQCPHTD